MPFIPAIPLRVFPAPAVASHQSLRCPLQPRGTARSVYRMTAAPTTQPNPLPDQSPLDGSAGTPAFDWLSNWYPVVWEADLPPDRPHPFTLFNKHYVIFRDPLTDLYVAMDDVCPHRAAPLSEGRLFTQTSADGEKQTILECGYHGWRFNCQGRCVDIPVVDAARRIPSAANISGIYPTAVRIGLVFVWLGERMLADEEKIPIFPQLLETPEEDLTLFRNVRREFPIDFTTVVENVADPAHVQWAHHGSGQGDRRTVPRNAGIEVYERDWGRGVFRAGIRAGAAENFRLKVWYEAPGAVGYEVVTPARLRSGILTKGFYLMVYVVPIESGKCALFSVNGVVGNSKLQWIKRLTPRWVEHLASNIVLDGDSLLLQWQETYLQSKGRDGLGGAWKKEYTLASGSWDALVVEFRRWLDVEGKGMPFVGGRAGVGVERLPRTVLNDRYEWHTRQCGSCNAALRNLRAGRIASWIGAAVGAAVSVAAMVLESIGAEQGLQVQRGVVARLGISGGVVCAILMGLSMILSRYVERLTYSEVAYVKSHAPSE
eukprot:GFKZ01008032.1.p1 GENE.GFKZ01008032.1~~GFKZ01008032.1.p1  ORF type:complete len:579 (-),score=38.05 GFKZ01008032.1:193-1824(-)